jgi:CheY-like chemotaxis protein/anti-sigma regulatory factor (Ser/Thr protein kinase)
MVVDDTRVNQLLLEAMLKSMGYRSLLAGDAEQALTLFKEHSPDLILMDVMMPGIDGYEAVRQIRRVADTWVPIIFVSALTEVSDMVKGLHAGGDDYLPKPVNPEVLKAKLGVFADRLRMSRLLAEQNRILLDHRARIEEEGKTAQDFMRKLVALEDVDDPAVRFFLQAAETFSGDLIAVARTPSNQLHILLADSTGHGLTAALAVTPVLQPFHAMTAKGFSIAAIAAEINRKVKEYLPIHHFVAATLLSMDGANQNISVWNGGCPPVVVLNEDGLPVWQFDSNHVPLGILAPDEFDAKLEHFRISDDAMCQIVLCSDGAMDALEHTNSELGMKKLLGTARESEREQRFPEMVKLLQRSVASSQAVDDIALIVLDCHVVEQAMLLSKQDKKPVEYIPEDTELAAGGNCDLCGWRFSLLLTAQQLRTLDVVPMLLNLVKQMETEDVQLTGQLFMVLSELFNNALDHGLLRLDSALKHDPEGMERYYEERAARLRDLTDGEISLEFERIYGEESYLSIRLKDSGAGFDVAEQMRRSRSRSDNRHGRGIMLVRDICCAVEYRGNGSEVIAKLGL